MIKRLAVAALLITTHSSNAEKFDLLPPEIMDALAKVEVVSQSIKADGPMPSVLLMVKNGSTHHFQMLSVACSIMKKGQLVGTAEGIFMNLAPGVSASDEALYMMTKQNLDADAVECRPSIGM